MRLTCCEVLQDQLMSYKLFDFTTTAVKKYPSQQRLYASQDVCHNVNNVFFLLLAQVVQKIGKNTIKMQPQTALNVFGSVQTVFS